MKKFIIISLITTGFCSVIYAQDPERSMSTEQARALNGSAQPKMKDGKPYSQWVAEEKAKKQAIMPSAVEASSLVTLNSSQAKPAPVNTQQTQQAGPDAGVAAERVKVTATSVVKTNEPPPSKEGASGSLPFANGGGVTAIAPAPLKEQVIAGTSIESKAVIPSAVNRNNAGTEGDGHIAVPSKTVKAPAANTVQPDANKAALKGTTMDPDAKAVEVVQQPASPSLPAQHSGNTAAPKTEDKPAKQQ